MIETEDITDQLLSLAEGSIDLSDAASSPVGYKLWDQYSLNSLSCDVEIDNPRTDFRFKRKFVALQDQVATKRVVHPNDLTNEQLVWMLDQMLVRVAAWLNGWPIPHCFYDLA